MPLIHLLSVIMCLLFIAQGLLHSHSHLQTQATLQAYLNELLNIENTFKSQIQTLQNFAATVNKNATALEGFAYMQAGTLENGISEERRQLYEIASKLVLPLEKRAQDCQLLSQAQVDSINKQISQSQANIDQLQSKIKAQPDCQRNNQLEIQLQDLNLYVNRLVKQLGSNCAKTVTPPTPPKNVYVVNPRNQFFVYGSQGQQGYNQKVNSLLGQGYIKIQCPAESPYPKNTSCVSCPQDKLHYYDLTKEVCLTCPQKYRFQVSNHTCIRKPVNPNPNAPNFVGPLPTPIEGADTCPIQTPFAKGGQCIGCPQGSFYDYANNTCKSCPAGTTFDTATRLCIYKKFNSNPGNGTKNYCCGPLPNDPGLDTCPAQSPFFNGQECVTCWLPAYFNIQALTCSLCPDNQKFSTNKQRCVDAKYLQPRYNSSLGDDVINYYGTPEQPDPQYEVVRSCPKQAPFFNGASCVECSLPRYFNFQANKCEVCTSQNRFDVGAKKCIKISTQQMNSNMTAIDNYSGKIPDFNPAFSTCPGAQPFFNGQTCVVCQLPKYVDFNSVSCRQCSPAYSFSLYNRQCLVIKASNYTDLAAKNIFYNGNFSSLAEAQQKQKKQNPRMQQCPEEAPYFNKQTDACLKCPEQFPLFDYKYNRCISCGGKSEFNEDSHLCTEQGRVSATIERMMMNTIGWI